MADNSELVARLRRADEYAPLGNDGWEAADTIETQAAQIAGLHQEIYDLTARNKQVTADWYEMHTLAHKYWDEVLELRKKVAALAEIGGCDG